MIKVIDGEPLPAPQPQHEWHGHRFQTRPVCSIPSSCFGALVLSGILRAMLGRLLGALATGGLVGGDRLVRGRPHGWSRSSPRLIAFLFTLFGDCTSHRGGGGRGGGFSGSRAARFGGSSSSGGGFSGGGGSFGGGGASGSW